MPELSPNTQAALEFGGQAAASLATIATAKAAAIGASAGAGAVAPVIASTVATGALAGASIGLLTGLGISLAQRQLTKSQRDRVDLVLATDAQGNQSVVQRLEISRDARTALGNETGLDRSLFRNAIADIHGNIVQFPDLEAHLGVVRSKTRFVPGVPFLGVLPQQRSPLSVRLSIQNPRRIAPSPAPAVTRGVRGIAPSVRPVSSPPDAGRRARELRDLASRFPDLASKARSVAEFLNFIRIQLRRT